MKKNGKIFLLIFIIIVTLTACGKQKTDTSAEVSSETMVLEDVAMPKETQGEETQGEVLEETQEKTVVETQEEASEEKQEEVEEEEFSAMVNEVADIETEEWNEQEIISLFNSKAEEDWTVIDCAAVTDFAYERIGVVLYKDSTSEYTHVAFLDADGNMQSCGVEAEYCEEFGLEYCGDGEVSFGTQTKDGITYLQKITISIEGSEVNFISESVADDEE